MANPFYTSPMEAKPRPIKLEAHVLAYLGDFMNLFEESVRRQILKEINTPSGDVPAPKPSATSSPNTSGQPPVSQ